MTRETRIWLIVMLLGAAALIGRVAFSEVGMGREYVRAAPVADGQWTQYNTATYGEYVQAEAAQPGPDGVPVQPEQNHRAVGGGAVHAGRLLIPPWR